MLPFDSLLDDEPLLLSNGTEIPRFGSLTLNEAIASQRLAGSEAIASIQGEDSSAADWLLFELLATLLIRFRARPNWRLEDTRGLPAADVILAANWFLNEQNWWGNAPEAGDKPADWAETYCRLKLDYPTEEWVNRRDFANQPLCLIQQFLKTAQQRELERLANEARVTANLAVTIAAANGAKKPKTRHFNDFEWLLFVQRAVEEFPPAMAIDLLELCERGKVPEWVIHCLDLELVRASAGTLEK